MPATSVTTSSALYNLLLWSTDAGRLPLTLVPLADRDNLAETSTPLSQSLVAEALTMFVLYVLAVKLMGVVRLWKFSHRVEGTRLSTAGVPGIGCARAGGTAGLGSAAPA